MAAEGSELGSPATAASPAPKRRKIEPPRRPSQVALLKDKLAAPSSNSSVAGALPAARVDLNKISEAKRFAVLQAQHEGCLGTYKSFDSHFGNYLVPVIPSDDFLEQIGKSR